MIIVAIILFALCWGSFLNVVGYRLLRNQSIVMPRSRCPQCQQILHWYDLIPVFSWLWLRGKCRFCAAPITLLYPFIELLTALLFVLLYLYVPADYVVGYAFFFSALVVAIRTDLEAMLVSQYTTLFLVPVGWWLSAFGLLPVSIIESVMGSVLGYGLLYGVNELFFYMTQRRGMGEGDMDMLACIGAFTGPVGCWVALLIASCAGVLFGAVYALMTTGRVLNVRIPFVPALALGAIVYVFCGDILLGWCYLSPS